VEGPTSDGWVGIGAPVEFFAFAISTAIGVFSGEVEILEACPPSSPFNSDFVEAQAMTPITSNRIKILIQWIANLLIFHCPPVS
jgi:hypothetical protein